ncbi:MAG: hypothetical protein NZ602_15270 [Thermoguttaceae bacterium]|nr:hypothetical protein [Thermoguttaceae bacterium]MDW8039688.1 hypothetical protein [Thermoguttaceae bacterium]
MSNSLLQHIVDPKSCIDTNAVHWYLHNRLYKMSGGRQPDHPHLLRLREDV